MRTIHLTLAVAAVFAAFGFFVSAPAQNYPPPYYCEDYASCGDNVMCGDTSGTCPTTETSYNKRTVICNDWGFCLASNGVGCSYGAGQWCCAYLYYSVPPGKTCDDDTFVCSPPDSDSQGCMIQ